MSWFRRRRPVDATPAPLVVAPWSPPGPDVEPGEVISPSAQAARTEQVMFDLATAVESLSDRLARLEARLDGVDATTTADLDELRSGTTRLATEVVRLNIDFRADLAAVADRTSVRPSARPRPLPAGGRTPASTRRSYRRPAPELAAATRADAETTDEAPTDPTDDDTVIVLADHQPTPVDVPDDGSRSRGGTVDLTARWAAAAPEGRQGQAQPWAAATPGGTTLH